MSRKKRESDRDIVNRIKDPIPAPGIGSRISAIADLYKSRIDASTRCGISSDTLRRWEREGVTPSFDALACLALGVGASLEWVATGKGPMLVDEAPGPGEADSQHVYAPMPRHTKMKDGEEVDVESEITSLSLSRKWLESKGLSPSDMVYTRMHDDSMRPTIPEGGLIVIDASTDKIRGDGLYALIYADDLTVKRLQIDHSGGIWIRTDNTAYREEYIDKAGVPSLSIVGKVVWVGGEV